MPDWATDGQNYVFSTSLTHMASLNIEDSPIKIGYLILTLNSPKRTIPLILTPTYKDLNDNRQTAIKIERIVAVLGITSQLYS